MAFTAGSPELTKAVQLANDLAGLRAAFSTSFAGSTAAQTIESQAANYGFGITGLTTGAGFPPFGSFVPSFNNSFPPVTAVLQNPRGETMASGITLGAIEGQTVGIYLKKFVRSGADYIAQVASGISLAVGYTAGSGNTFVARGPITIHTNDLITFGDGISGAVATYIVTGGNTSAAVGGTAAFSVLGTVQGVYATGAAFSISSKGITRGTSGVAGSTFESYPRNTVVNAGFTAAVYYNWTSASGSTWSIS